MTLQPTTTRPHQQSPKLRVFCLGLSTLLLCPPLAASLTAVDAMHPGLTAVVQLRCRNPQSGRQLVSLGTLLEIRGEQQVDVVLATAHGLGEAIQHCRVQTGGGYMQPADIPQTRHVRSILAVQQGQGLGSQSDWAVLTLNGRLPAEHPRLRWRTLNPAEIAYLDLSAAAIHLVKHTNGETGAPCRMRRPPAVLQDEHDQHRLVTGNCITLPGMSGAPVLVKADGQPTLIGLNIGQRFSLAQPPAQMPSHTNLMRLVDGDISRAIHAAAQPHQTRPTTVGQID